VKHGHLIFAASLLVLGISLYVTADLGEEKFSSSGDVVDVTDGDTVDISSGNGNYTVRLLGVDAPETQAANSPGEFGMEDSLQNRKCLERWGEKATEYLKKEISDGEIEFSTDPAADRRGSYGRLLAYLEKNSSPSYNLMLVKKGYARVYISDFKRLDKFRKAERSAREEEVGLWSCG
jgi:micrococcal nuclease